MIHQCLDCGLAVQDGDAWHCFKYRKLVTEDPQGCPSFIERQFEDGEIDPDSGTAFAAPGAGA